MQRESDDYRDALTFASDTPDVTALREAYANCVIGIEDYLDQTRAAYNERHEIWPGKSSDGRKNGPSAFPWVGASDLETRLVETKLQTYVALSMDAMHRSHIQAYPVEVSDTSRARIVSSFLKWMTTSWIDGFQRYLDRSANHFYEKGLMVTHVGWEQVKMPREQEITLQELEGQFPGISQLVADKENDEQLAGMMEAGGVSPKRAKRALKDLRKAGMAKLVTSKVEIDRPTVTACSPDADCLFPAWCVDPKRAPYAFFRDYLTPQEILARVDSDGWDAGWADYVIEHMVGMSTIEFDSDSNARRGSRLGRYQSVKSDLVEVIWMYRRLIDEEDGAEGIYCTVFHPDVSGEQDAAADQPQAWAKHYLLSDLESFPFVVTELSSSEGRMYEVTTMPDLIRSAANSIKVERDSRIDRNSLSTLPELHHPAGRKPPNRGPGRSIGYRRRDEVYYGDVPKVNPDAVMMDLHLTQQIDKLLGLDMEDPDSRTKKNYYIQKFLRHQRDVLSLCYDFYKLYGPDELFFRVTGLPEQMEMIKEEDEKLDITVSFDSLQTEPEAVEKMLQQLFAIIPMDQGGRINMDAVITFAASAISPTLASQILQPSEQGQQELLKQFTEDWAKIYSGVEVDAPPNGAGVIMPALQGLQKQSDVVERYQGDEAFRTRVDNYTQQLQFQQQQVQNAETGRRGAKPADITLNQAPYPKGSNGE